MSQLLDDLGKHLAAHDVGFYSTTEVCPDGRVLIAVSSNPATPDRCIILDTYPGGPEPDSVNGWQHPRLQVRVRSRDPLDALAMDQGVFDVLQAAVGKYPMELSDSSWLLQDCYAIQSSAEPLGQDETGRHEYVRNYQLDTEPAPTP